MKVVFMVVVCFITDNLYHMLIVVFYFLLIFTFFLVVSPSPHPDLCVWTDHVVQN